MNPGIVSVRVPDFPNTRILRFHSYASARFGGNMGMKDADSLDAAASRDAKGHFAQPDNFRATFSLAALTGLSGQSQQ